MSFIRVLGRGITVLADAFSIILRREGPVGTILLYFMEGKTRKVSLLFEKLKYREKGLLHRKWVSDLIFKR
jgi:hypothetical protein